MTPNIKNNFTPKIGKMSPLTKEVDPTSKAFKVKQEVTLNGKALHFELKYSGQVNDDRIADDLDKTIKKVAALVDHYDLGGKSREISLSGDEIKVDQKLEGYFTASAENPYDLSTHKFTPVKESLLSPAEIEKINNIYQAALALQLKKVQPKESPSKPATPLVQSRDKMTRLGEQELAKEKEILDLDQKLQLLKEKLAKDSSDDKALEELNKLQEKRARLYVEWKRISQEHDQVRASLGQDPLVREVHEMAPMKAQIIKAIDPPSDGA